MSITDQRCVRRVVLRFFAVGWILVGIALLAAGLWRVRLRWQVERGLEAIRQAGLPATAADLNRWRAPVADAENASLLITQAFARVRPFPDQRSNAFYHIILPVRGGCPDAAVFEWMAGFVRMNAPALATAREAVRRPRARYVTDFTRGPVMLLRHLNVLHDLGRLAEMEGLVAVQHGQAAAAVESARLALGLARTLEEEPILLSQCLRLELIRGGVRTLEAALAVPGLDETALAGMAGELAAAERANLFERAFVAERAMVVSSIWRRSAQANQRAKEDMPTVVRVLSDGLLGADFDFFAPIDAVLGLNDFEALDVLRTMGAQLKSYRLPWPQKLETTSYSAPREAVALAQLRAARVAVAVERFRLRRERLPSALCELRPEFLKAIPLDPVDGQPLRYQRRGQGYVVYGIGLDGRDDGGRERPNLWPNGRLPADETGPPARWRGRLRAHPDPAAPHDLLFVVER